MLRTELAVLAWLERVTLEPLAEEWEPEYDPVKTPPATSEPRTERMIRIVIVVVRTAAMLKRDLEFVMCYRDDCIYLVTTVLTVSSIPVGLMMNQNKTLAKLTIQMDCYKSWNQQSEEG